VQKTVINKIIYEYLRLHRTGGSSGGPVSRSRGCRSPTLPGFRTYCAPWTNRRRTRTTHPAASRGMMPHSGTVPCHCEFMERRELKGKRSGTGRRHKSNNGPQRAWEAIATAASALLCYFSTAKWHPEREG